MNKIIFCWLFLFINTPLLSQDPQLIYLDDDHDIIYDIDVYSDQILVSLSSTNIFTWDLNTKSLIYKYSHSGQNLTCLDLTNSGDLLAFGDRSGTISIVNIKSWDIIAEKAFNEFGAVTDVIFDANDSKISASFVSGKVIVWKIDNNELKEFQAVEKFASSVALNKEGDLLAVGDNQGATKFFELTELKELNSFKYHSSRISNIIWREDEPKILTSGYDGNVFIYENKSKENLYKSEKKINKLGPISGIDYLPGTSTIATSSLSGSAKIYFNHGIYSFKRAIAMHDVKFIPTDNGFLLLALATNGSGVMLLDARMMKVNETGRKKR